MQEKLVSKLCLKKKRYFQKFERKTAIKILISSFNAA